jgi:predicted Zn-ribbon and HTH transcriptional regulator
MTARPPMQLTAKITCPQCGYVFTGRWEQGKENLARRCPRGHIAATAWPGFTFAPERRQR